MPLDCNILNPIGNKICDALGLKRGKYYASWMDINYYVLLHNDKVDEDSKKIRVDWEEYTNEVWNHTNHNQGFMKFREAGIYRHPFTPLNRSDEHTQNLYATTPRLYDITLFTSS